MNGLNYKRLLLENDNDVLKIKEVLLLPEVSRFVSISESYFKYVTSTAGVYFYKVYMKDTLVATTHLEISGSVLYMDVVVFPEYQGKGIGKSIIKDVQNDVFGLQYDVIEVAIDESNLASLRAFEHSGFRLASKDGELLNFTYRRKFT